jgi:hypothetical protein
MRKASAGGGRVARSDSCVLGSGASDWILALGMVSERVMRSRWIMLTFGQQTPWPKQKAFAGQAHVAEQQVWPRLGL